MCALCRLLWERQRQKTSPTHGPQFGLSRVALLRNINDKVVSFTENNMQRINVKGLKKRRLHVA